MEWLILLLLVPAIIVPIVLLCGFAGCTSFGAGADTTVAAPSNLTAVATGTDGIKLGWQDNSGGTAKFNVERLDGGTWNKISPDLSFPTGAPIEFTDGGRNDGTDGTYRVKAIKGAGVESVPSNEAKATTKPNAPTNLVATPEDVNKIVLKWNHVTKSNKTLKFKIKHTRKTPPGGFIEISTSATTLDSTVAEGSENEYQVTAVVNGFENSISKDIESDPSVPPASAKPLAFKADVATNQPQTIAPGNYCFVQRIAAADLHASGPQVRIIVSGIPAGNVMINSIYISKVANPGNPGDYQSAADIKPVITSALTLPDDKPKTLGPVPYNLDKGSDLIIAFDFTASAGNDKIRFVTAPPVALYFKVGVQQAAGPRDADYFPQPDPRLYLIEKIEVL